VFTLAICSALIGSILGIRFRFVVLLPIAFIGSIFLAASSIAQGKPFFQALLTIVVFASILQLGYICGALLRHAVKPAHAAGRWSLLGSPRLR
jgi:hypothetical protein